MFEKYSVYQNAQNAVSDNLFLPPPARDLHLWHRFLRLLVGSHLPVKTPGYGPAVPNETMLLTTPYSILPGYFVLPGTRKRIKADNFTTYKPYKSS